jgi:predicted ATP-grasp superfamily ATP-dependent carboligase
VASYRRLTHDFTADEFKLMICEIIPGPDSAQMVQYVSYIDGSGEVLAAMTSRKMRQDPPRYGQGRIARSERIPGLDEKSYRLLREVGYHGFSEIEWKYDPREGLYKLIEINPRFIFYIGLCVACGINFPYIQYADLVRNEKIRVDSFRENVYWIHEYKDVLHTALHHRLESLSLWDYLRPYLGRKYFAIFDPRDPGPFYHQWKEHMGNVLKRRLCASK